MANFIPSKKVATDFNNGTQYINGDVVQAETVNNLVESALYSQDTAQQALTKVDNVIEGVALPPAVGMHHIQFPNELTPAQIWAGTSWEIDTDYQGRTLIGSGGSYVLGSTGGSANAVVVKHTHTIGYPAPTGGGFTVQQSSYKNVFDCSRWETEWGEFYTNEPDGEYSDGIGKNIPPYIVVNFWKRTA